MRDKILTAARQRFARNGYCKTAMAKIAKDAEMSAGNLYHYFESKLDIAEALCCEACDGIYGELGIAAKDTAQPAEKRLRAFLLGELRLSYQRLDALPRLVEMAEEVISKRPDVKRLQLRTSRSLIAEILAQGIASHEFRIGDVLVAASSIQIATMKYRYPQLFSVQPLPELETELGHLVDLMLHGLSRNSEQLSDNSSLSLERT